MTIFIIINSVSVMMGCLALLCNVTVFLMTVDYQCVLSDFRRQATYTKYCHLDLFGFYERLYYFNTPTERFMSIVFSLSIISLSFICLSRIIMVWIGNC